MREILQTYITNETNKDGLIDAPKMGHQLKLARQKQQLTLKQVATLTGITEKHLQSLEKGKSIPTLNTLKNLITALEVSPDWLFANELPTDKTVIYQEIKDDFEKLSEEQQGIVESLIKGYLNGIKSINNT